MLLKRHYKPMDDWPDRATPALAHIEVLHTGWKPEQHFSTRLVSAGLAGGWLTIGEGQLVLKTKPEALVYTIARGPGRYCCHCGEKLEDDERGEMARAHILAKHPDVLSPDRQNPAGYCLLNHYACVLDPAQHARWSLTRDASGHLFRGSVRWKGEQPVAGGA